MRSLTLAALAFVLTPLGAVAPAAQSAPSYGTPVSFSSPGADQIGVTRLDGDRFIVAYRRGEGRVKVGQVGADGGVTLGSSFIFDGGLDEQEIHVEALDTSRFVVAWRRLNEVYAAVGEVNGLDVSFGAATFLEANCKAGIDLDVLDSERFVVVYSDDGPGRARVVSASGTTVTLGAEATFESAQTYLPQITALDATRFVVTYTNLGAPFAVVGEANGTASIGFGPLTTLPGPAYSVDALDPTRFLVAMELPVGSGVAVGSSSGTTVTGLGPLTAYNPDPSSLEVFSWVEVLGEDRFVVSWYDGLFASVVGCLSGTCGYRSRKGTVSGDTIASLSEAVEASETSGENGGIFNFDQTSVGSNEAFVIAFSSPGTYEPVVRRAGSDGSCAIQNGSGANPLGYACVNEPLVGTTWSATVDDVPSVGVATAATVIGFGLGGATSGAFLPAGELLVLPPYAQDVALGLHSLPLGPSVPVGLTIPSQAARIEVTPGGGFTVVLLNGIDLFLGG